MKPNWFIALPIPAENWLPDLLSAAPRGCRLFHQADVHLTVAFLGGVSEEQAIAAWREVGVGSRRAPLDVTLGASRPMGNPKQPSALALTVDRGHDALVELLDGARGPAFGAAGIPAPKRPSLPHVTIARPTRRASAAQRDAFFGWGAGLQPPTEALTLDRIALYTWSPDRKERLFFIKAQRRWVGHPDEG
ncbi:MAG: 2'-5' RNA ligase [Bradymonadia bacterium]|jgi:2'-5' RNA ligase